MYDSSGGWAVGALEVFVSICLLLSVPLAFFLSPLYFCLAFFLFLQSTVCVCVNAFMI